QALVIPADAAPGLRSTPAEPPFATRVDVDVLGQVSDLGTLKVGVRYLVRGDAEVLLRMGFRVTPATHWQALAASMASAEDLDGDVTAGHASDPTATRRPSQFSFDLPNARYAAWPNKRARRAPPRPIAGFPADTALTS